MCVPQSVSSVSLVGCVCDKCWIEQNVNEQSWRGIALKQCSKQALGTGLQNICCLVRTSMAKGSAAMSMCGSSAKSCLVSGHA